MLAPPDLKTALVHTMKSNLVGQQRQARDQKCVGEKHVHNNRSKFTCLIV